MKNFWLTVVITLGLVASGMAAEKIEAPDSCVHCGMNRTTFAHSRMLVDYDDGTSVGTCSIACVATELQHSNGKKQIKSIRVADYASKKLIDAKTATWIIGGKKPGVMTAVAKWAFADKKSAVAFRQANGGKLTTFAAVMKEADKEYAQNSGGAAATGHTGH